MRGIRRTPTRSTLPPATEPATSAHRAMPHASSTASPLEPHHVIPAHVCPWCHESVGPTTVKDVSAIGANLAHRSCALEYRLGELETQFEQLARMLKDIHFHMA